MAAKCCPTEPFLNIKHYNTNQQKAIKYHFLAAKYFHPAITLINVFAKQ
jgi:hypothetical protein